MRDCAAAAFPNPSMSKSPLPGDPSRAESNDVANDVADDVAAEPLPFEQALEELEGLVQRMEDGTLSLAQSLAAYRRGAELVKVCETALEHVKDQVRVVDGTLSRPLAEVALRGAERG